MTTHPDAKAEDAAIRAYLAGIHNRAPQGDKRRPGTNTGWLDTLKDLRADA